MVNGTDRKQCLTEGVMMRKSGLAVTLALGLTAGIVGGAQASTINFGTWTLTTGPAPAFAKSLEDFSTFTPGATIPVGSSLHGPAPFNASVFSAVNHATVENTDVVNQHVFDAFVPHTGNYGVVFGGGSLTISLSGPAHYFGLDWGTVDTYNKISFLDWKGTTLASFTGADLSGDGKSAQFANFTTNLGIRKIVLTSQHNSFEFDDLKVSSVPLPAALPLFGAALAAIGAGRLKRRKPSANQ